jgi:hypothetical protein
MTPFAHEITKDSLLPTRQRRYDAVMKALRLLDGVHFFECTALHEMAIALGQEMLRRGFSETLAFLPAPRTALEILGTDGDRVLLVLEETTPGWCEVRGAFQGMNEAGPLLEMPLKGNPALARRGYRRLKHAPPEHLQRAVDVQIAAIYACLAMINTPRVIMRRQHMPHRGLQKRLVAARGLAGSWPLNAWHEIELRVCPPTIDEREHEAHLTGERALHFVRAHLRIRLGRLEMVSAHWRGDGSLGIVQTRYRLAPPPPGPAGVAALSQIDRERA